MTMTAKDVCGALYRHWAPKWVVLFEISATPPIPEGQRWRGVGEADRVRRIDVLALRRLQRQAQGRFRYAGDGWERLAVEVKVSRADFLSDVANPHKQSLWRGLTHAFAYAAPKGLIRLDELPEGVGLLEIDRRDNWTYVEWARKARWRDTAIGPLPHQVLNAIGHRLSRAEALARGYLTSVDHDVDSLRVENERLRRQLDVARNEADRERQLRQQWQQRYAAVGDPPCGSCGQPLRISRKRGTSGWEHRPEHADTCEQLRRPAAVEAERARIAQMDDEERQYYIRTWGPGPATRTHLYVSPPLPAERLEDVA